jgi:hypothetical protein
MDKVVEIKLFGEVWKAKLLCFRNVPLGSFETEITYHAILTDPQGREFYDFVYESDIIRGDKND